MQEWMGGGGNWNAKLCNVMERHDPREMKEKECRKLQIADPTKKSFETKNPLWNPLCNSAYVTWLSSLVFFTANVRSKAFDVKR